MPVTVPNRPRSGASVDHGVQNGDSAIEALELQAGRAKKGV